MNGPEMKIEAKTTGKRSVKQAGNKKTRKD
jgi:hypothetical protein